LLVAVESLGEGAKPDDPNGRVDEFEEIRVAGHHKLGGVLPRLEASEGLSCSVREVSGECGLAWASPVFGRRRC
jgi:hypothetical protein